jgi:hypothetical protein
MLIYLTVNIFSTPLFSIQAIEVQLNINPVTGYARNAIISTGVDGKFARLAIPVSEPAVWCLLAL